MGLATVQYKNAAEKMAAVPACEEARLSVDSKPVYLGFMQSEIQAMLDKPVRTIQKFLRDQWMGVGGKKDVEVDWKQRTVSVCQQVVCRQEEDLTMRCFKRKTDIIDMVRHANSPAIE